MGDPVPGIGSQNEAWQREKQMIGQDADQPGKPRTWKQGDQAQRNPGAGDAAPAGRDGVSMPAGNTDDDGEDAGTDTGGVGDGRCGATSCPTRATSPRARRPP